MWNIAVIKVHEKRMIKPLIETFHKFFKFCRRNDGKVLADELFVLVFLG